MKIIAALILCAAALSVMRAEEREEIKTETDLSIVVSTAVEAQVGVEQRFIVPFLRGTGPLTSGNNITLKAGAELSPISFNVFSDAVWTPAAFFKFSLGGRAGSGWNYDLLGSFMNGMGLYQRDDNESPKERAQGSGLDGVVWNVHSGATLQFDLAAVFPGEWNHLVMVVDTVLNYQNYSKAKGDEQWYFRGDDGVNQNWFSWYFSGFLGYQMPLVLNVAGFMFEASLPLSNPQSGASLSGREPEIICSLAAGLTPSPPFTIMALVQASNRLIHPVRTDYKREWKFYRVALVGVWHIRR